ncbi:MAG: ABC transporter ATP-binding protein [Burkholderiaceae bacterium]
MSAAPDPAPRAGAPVLEARGLTVDLGDRRVLDNVSIALHAGCWTAIVGPNGAGKSTLLATLSGLRRPRTGERRLLGRRLDDWTPRERARRLAWLSQHGEADGEIAARDVVRLGRLPHHGLLGAPDADDEAAVDAAMRETECEAFGERRLGALSGGERQRVLIARMLAVDAPVLLMDEPTTHLDAPHQRALVRSLRARAAAGAAVATVLHDLGLALSADRLLVLAHGRVTGIGTPDDPAVHTALGAAFGGAIRIVRLTEPGATRWVAVPCD